eukprot:764508-Hanusia_phi.AAC.2
MVRAKQSGALPPIHACCSKPCWSGPDPSCRKVLVRSPGAFGGRGGAEKRSGRRDEGRTGWSQRMYGEDRRGGGRRSLHQRVQQGQGREGCPARCSTRPQKRRRQALQVRSCSSTRPAR